MCSPQMAFGLDKLLDNIEKLCNSTSPKVIGANCESMQLYDFVRDLRLLTNFYTTLAPSARRIIADS